MATMLFVVLGLLLGLSGAQALYESSSAVVELTPENFEKRVLKSRGVWLVEFYAPWCGHCQSLAPEYSKVARALKGIAGVGAIDMDRHKELGGPYGIQGFPTIKIFGENKAKPVDYRGERTAKGLADAVLKEVRGTVIGRLGGGNGEKTGKKAGGSKGDVVELTEANFDDLVLGSSDVWMVEFFAPWCGHCKNLEPEWARAATDLKGTAKLGAVDATVHTSLAGRYGVNGYPTIKVFGADKTNPMDYPGGRDTQSIVDYAKEVAERSTPPPEVRELVGPQVWEEECEGKGRICVVTVLPHILDSSAAERNGYIATLKVLAEKNKMRSFRWLWTEAGKQAGLEGPLDIGGAGYPALAAVSVSKEAYSNMRRAFDQPHIQLFLTGLMAGKEPLAPLRDAVKVLAVDAWDGKDGVLPVDRDEL